MTLTTTLTSALTTTMPRKAMILAAGFGTRLWPLTIGRTKPALPFLNRPLIAFTIDWLKRFGVTEFIINLHHEPASVRAQLSDGSPFGVRIHYAMEEPVILGTAGALDNVRHLLEDDTFIVVNGKIITDIDLHDALATHRAQHAIATLVLRPNAQREHFREVHRTPDGKLAGFGEFPAPSTQHAARGTQHWPLMFTGIHLLEPRIFDYIPRGVESDSVRDVYPAAMAAGEIIGAHVAECGDWYELSTLERYHAISMEFLRRTGRDVVMDKGCVVAASARVSNSILWQRVRVEADAELQDCIVADDVVIPAGARFNRAIIVPAALAAAQSAPPKANPGVLVGANLVTPF